MKRSILVTDRVPEFWVLEAYGAACALYFEKSSILAKNEENPCPTCIQLISGIDFLSQKIRFQKPCPSLKN
jgi:hypothetical protein